MSSSSAMMLAIVNTTKTTIEDDLTMTTEESKSTFNDASSLILNCMHATTHLSQQRILENCQTLEACSKK